jgi:KDO2-lipid IV(A) lauroyltransferase
MSARGSKSLAAGWVDRAGWAVSRGCRGLVRALPHSAARPLGAALGGFARRLDPRHPRVARYNLETVMPELGPDRRLRLIDNCFRHFGAVLIDTISLGRFDPVGICQRLTLEGWEHLEAAERLEQGTLVMTAHLGNWELVGYALALYRGPTHVVARPTGNPWVEADLRRFRERFGNRTIYKRGAARKMLAAIRRGERVAYVIDQRVHPNEGIETPFFGRTSFTSPLLARLSLRTGAPVVPMFAYPEPPDRFRVVVHPPIAPENESEEPALELTLRYLRVIESVIRARPEMWLWMHERWRKH